MIRHLPPGLACVAAGLTAPLSVAIANEMQSDSKPLDFTPPSPSTFYQNKAADDLVDTSNYKEQLYADIPASGFKLRRRKIVGRMNLNQRQKRKNLRRALAAGKKF